MQIFGLEPVIATLVISVVGVGIQVGLGILQSPVSFEYKKLLASAIIGVFSAFAIVGPAIGAIPENADPSVMFSIVVGLVAAVAGIDVLFKNVGKSISNRKAPKTQ